MDQTRKDALRLLTVINETQAHGHIGATVIPGDAAEEAGMLPPEPTESEDLGDLRIEDQQDADQQDAMWRLRVRYRDAIWHLTDEEALIRSEKDAWSKWWEPDAYGAQLVYTARAQEMLQEG